MKTKMRGFVALLMAAMIMAGMIPAHSEAKKVTYYKTKKVFLQTKETKIVKTTKKIKKVVGVNQTLKGVAKGKKISGKKIKFTPGKASGNTGLDEEDIMVTYTNGKKQKFIVKTVNPYLEKIAKKLRPLVKNPDEGLRIIAHEYEQCYQTGKKDYFENLKSNPRAYKNMLKRTANKKYTYEWTALENLGGECTVDDIIKKATKSQKIALILETYCDMNMKYNKDSKGRPVHGEGGVKNRYKAIYQGTYKGVCGESSERLYEICEVIGVKAGLASNPKENHEWLCIAAVDKNGKKYWQGVPASSYQRIHLQRQRAGYGSRCCCRQCVHRNCQCTGRQCADAAGWGSDCRHQLPRPRFPYSVGQSSLHQHWCISLRCHHISDYCILCVPDCQGSQHDAKSDLQEKRRRKERRTGKGCSRHCPAD